MIVAIGKFLLGIGFFYAALCVALFFVQRSFIYYPGPNFPDIPERDGAGFIRVATEDDLTLIGWYMPAAENKKTILYFHGNVGDIGQRYPMAERYIEEGYGVLLAGYRGYGGNPGRPSEQGFYKDARAYLQFLTEAQDVGLGDIVLYGESIGSGPAVQLAYENPSALAGIILITPFSQVADIAHQAFPFLPVGLLLRDRFDNISKVGALSMPQYYFAAGADEVVPPELTRALYEAASEPKFWHEFPETTHNEIHQTPLIDLVSKALRRL